MSETITDTAPPEALAVEQTPVETPAAPASAEASAQEAEAPAETAAPAEPPVSKRIGNLTRKLAEKDRETTTERAARIDAERRLAAAEALLRQARGEDPAPTQQAPNSIEEAKRQLREEMQREALNSRLGEIDSKGKQEVGGEAWDQAKQVMQGFGATANDAFLHALAETENGHRIFAELADDPDKLTALLAKPPAAMAATLGRMDAKLSTPATPAPRPTSNAPRPPTPVQAVSTPPEPDIHKAASMDMDTFVAAMQREFKGNKLFGFR